VLPAFEEAVNDRQSAPFDNMIHMRNAKPATTIITNRSAIAIVGIAVKIVPNPEGIGVVFTAGYRFNSTICLSSSGSMLPAWSRGEL